MLNRVYCTYFDHNYLSRGLALYRSLRRHAPNSRLWVLCLSAECHRILVALDLPGIVPVRLADFEAADSELAATRADRTIVEYYFTCSPAWMLYVLAREADAEWVTYLDGDLYFFASPEAVYEELMPPTSRNGGVSVPTMSDGWAPATIRTASPSSNGGGSDASNGAMTTSMATATPTRDISIPFRCSRAV